MATKRANRPPSRYYLFTANPLTSDIASLSDHIHASAYNLSFTAASLRPELARIVAEHYLSEGDWDSARLRILDSNALQTRSTASARRLEIEFRRRLSTLSEGQITLIAEAPADDRAAISWLAAMKRSRFLFDFAADVLRDKLSGHDTVLRPSDYERFAEATAAVHPEYAGLAASSKEKVRTTLLNMLQEAGLLRGAAPRTGVWGTVQRPVLSPAALRSITDDDPRWLAGFLVPESEIQNL